MKETKKCPYCGEEILAVAKKCRYCGQWLEEKDVAEKTPSVGDKPTITVNTDNKAAVTEEISSYKPKFKNFFKKISLRTIIVSTVLVLLALCAVEETISYDICIIIAIVYAVLYSIMGLLMTQRLIGAGKVADIVSVCIIIGSLLFGARLIGALPLNLLENSVFDGKIYCDTDPNLLNIRWSIYILGMPIFFAPLAIVIDMITRVSIMMKNNKMKVTMAIGILSSVSTLVLITMMRFMNETVFASSLAISLLLACVYYILLIINSNKASKI